MCAEVVLKLVVQHICSIKYTFLLLSRDQNKIPVWYES